jgi:hypothetical protein
MKKVNNIYINEIYNILNKWSNQKFNLIPIYQIMRIF